MNFNYYRGKYKYRLRFFMKLFNVLPRQLTALNYAVLDFIETPKELKQYPQKFQNFWDKECKEHPTNQNCLIYCD